MIAYRTGVERVPEWSEKNFRDLAQDADCLIVDAQYTPEEYRSKEGWGHSTWKQSVESASDANAKQIVLFHHDPYHNDSVIDSILEEASKLHPNVVAAKEGLEVPVR